MLLYQSIYVRYLPLQNNRPNTEWLLTTKLYYPLVSLNQESGMSLVRCSEEGLSRGCGQDAIWGFRFPSDWQQPKNPLSKWLMQLWAANLRSYWLLLFGASVLPLVRLSLGLFDCLCCMASPIVDDTKEHEEGRSCPSLLPVFCHSVVLLAASESQNKVCT